MTGNSADGPEFVHDPYVPPPGPVIGEATIIAINDFYNFRNNQKGLSLSVLVNDTAPGGPGSFRIREITATSLGSSVAIAADGQSIIYNPATNGIGKDSFDYIVEDAEGNVGKASVSVHLSAPPVINPNQREGPVGDRYSFLEDQYDLPLFVLLNDRDFRDGTIVNVTVPSSGGAVHIADDGKHLDYSPAVGFRGYEYFEYTVRDDHGNTATAWVSVLIEARFMASSDGYSTDVDSPPVELRVLDNDYRRDNALSPITLSVEQPAYGGSVRVADDGTSLWFTPASGFIGSAVFQYSVRYGSADHHVVTAGVTVCVVDPYLAVDNWFLIDPDSADNVLEVLANDPVVTKQDNLLGQQRTLRITSVSIGSAGGQMVIAKDGKSIHYTPAAGFTGDETFTYTVIDNTGHEDSAKVTVDVGYPDFDPFNLPRFRTAAELEQFLLDEAVARYVRIFGTETRRYMANDPPADGGSAPANGLVDSMVLTYSSTAGDADYSTTNVQHAGIDEADVVETDGDYVYALSGGRLVIVDVRDLAHPQLVSVARFAHEFTEMYLQGDRLTLLSRGSSATNAQVLVLDVSDRPAPTVVERTEMDGWIVDSRAIGDRVHVVTQRHVVYPAPQLRVVGQLPSDDGAGTWEILQYETFDEYAARLAGRFAEASLPMFRTYNADGELIRSGLLSEKNQIHKPVSAADRTLVSVATFDVGDNLAGPITSTGFFNDPAQKIYVSHSAVYTLRASRYYDQHTEIFRFDFRNDGTTSLEAVGEVRGVTVNQFSLDEFEGRLRVVTTESVYGKVNIDGYWRTRLLRTDNHLFVLEQHGTRLEVVGSLENVAPTEQVKSVRFVGERAYVVTFRVVDPLFAIDLSDPTDPRIAGAIKIPGFSNYLHPVGEDYVIGFGRDANELTGELGAAQVSLFYVGDLDNPQLVDRMTLQGADWSWSEAYSDHHAVAYFAEHQVLSVPITWQAQVPAGDFNGDGIIDNWVPEQRSAAFVFQFELDGASGGMEFMGRIEHAAVVRRSLRIGDTLVTISDASLKVHSLANPNEQIADEYLGDLPRNDMFTVDEDSGPTMLDVLANDRPDRTGQPPSIVAVTQPAELSFWSPIIFAYDAYRIGSPGRPAGTVEIAPDGRSVIFTPADDFFGTATFTYTVFDELRGEQTATVTVNVLGVPDAPRAVDDEFEVEPGLEGNFLDVLANDVDPDAGYSQMVIVTDFVPFDSGADPEAANLVSPTASTLRDAVAVSEVPAISLSPLEGSYLAIPGLGLTIVSVGVADQGGTIEVDPTGNGLRYTPAAGFEGIETFTCTVGNSYGLLGTAKVAVRVGHFPDTTSTDLPQDLHSPPIASSAEQPIVAALDAADATIRLPVFDLRPSARSGAPSHTVVPSDIPNGSRLDDRALLQLAVGTVSSKSGPASPWERSLVELSEDQPVGKAAFGELSDAWFAELAVELAGRS